MTAPSVEVVAGVAGAIICVLTTALALVCWRLYGTEQQLRKMLLLQQHVMSGTCTSPLLATDSSAAQIGMDVRSKLDTSTGAAPLHGSFPAGASSLLNPIFSSHPPATVGLSSESFSKLSYPAPLAAATTSIDSVGQKDRGTKQQRATLADSTPPHFRIDSSVQMLVPSAGLVSSSSEQAHAPTHEHTSFTSTRPAYTTTAAVGSIQRGAGAVSPQQPAPPQTHMQPIANASGRAQPPAGFAPWEADILQQANTQSSSLQSMHSPPPPMPVPPHSSSSSSPPLLSRSSRSTHVDHGTLPAPAALTFVSTDIEGSTHIWEKGPAVMERSQEVHDRSLRILLAEHHGQEVGTEGDAFICTFESAAEAVLWCLNVQQVLMQADWPEELLDNSAAEERSVHDDSSNVQIPAFRGLRVRMGVCTGGEYSRSIHHVTGQHIYSGGSVELAEGLCSMAYGGQVLLCGATYRQVYGRLSELSQTQSLLQTSDTIHPQTPSGINPSLLSTFPSTYPAPLDTRQPSDFPPQSSPLPSMNRRLSASLPIPMYPFMPTPHTPTCNPTPSTDPTGISNPSPFRDASMDFPSELSLALSLANEDSHLSNISNASVRSTPSYLQQPMMNASFPPLMRRCQGAAIPPVMSMITSCSSSSGPSTPQRMDAAFLDTDFNSTLSSTAFGMSASWQLHDEPLKVHTPVYTPHTPWHTTSSSSITTTPPAAENEEPLETSLAAAATATTPTAATTTTTAAAAAAAAAVSLPASTRSTPRPAAATVLQEHDQNVYQRSTMRTATPPTHISIGTSPRRPLPAPKPALQTRRPSHTTIIIDLPDPPVKPNSSTDDFSGYPTDVSPTNDIPCRMVTGPPFHHDQIDLPSPPTSQPFNPQPLPPSTSPAPQSLFRSLSKRLISTFHSQEPQPAITRPQMGSETQAASAVRDTLQITSSASASALHDDDDVDSVDSTCKARKRRKRISRLKTALGVVPGSTSTRAAAEYLRRGANMQGGEGEKLGGDRWMESGLGLGVCNGGVSWGEHGLSEGPNPSGRTEAEASTQTATDTCLMETLSLETPTAPFSLLDTPSTSKPPPVLVDMGRHVMGSLEDAEEGAAGEHIVLIVPHQLRGRLRVWPPSLQSSRCVCPGYLQAPGAVRALAHLGQTIPSGARPFVTMAFASLDHQTSRALKAAGNTSEGPSRTLVMSRFCAIVRTTLELLGGYECQERNGVFMVAFPGLRVAMEWALLLQLALIQDAAEEADGQLVNTEAVYHEDGRVLFRGLRACVGVMHGEIVKICPHATTGRADYFGPVVNRAARLQSAAHGGQVLAGGFAVLKAVREWQEMETHAASNLAVLHASRAEEEGGGRDTPGAPRGRRASVHGVSWVQSSSSRAQPPKKTIDSPSGQDYRRASDSAIKSTGPRLTPVHPPYSPWPPPATTIVPVVVCDEGYFSFKGVDHNIPVVSVYPQLLAPRRQLLPPQPASSKVRHVQAASQQDQVVQVELPSLEGLKLS